MRVSTRPALERLQAIDSAVSRRAWPNARTLARELEECGRGHPLSGTEETWAAPFAPHRHERHRPGKDQPRMNARERGSDKRNKNCPSETLLLVDGQSCNWYICELLVRTG